MKFEISNMNFEQDTIKIIENNVTPKAVIQDIVDSGKQDEAFFVMDAGDILRKFDLWKKSLPTVKPFYAVKCNDSTVVLRILNALGTGFDCASKGEIAKVMSLGVAPERIIFANPSKPLSHIKYAAKVGVDLMTFDSQSELYKIKEYHPKAKLVLRLRCDAKSAQCPLGFKYGADYVTAVTLVKLAVELGLNLVGVSFHVGSGCKDLGAFSTGIKIALKLMGDMVYHGADPYILDIGGGFEEDSFEKTSGLISETLSSEVSSGVEVIAEPGRFFVESAFTLATAIHGTRNMEYYINDGVYGSFNCVLYDHATPRPQPLKEGECNALMEFKVWGPTCDSLDMVIESALLPLLEIGDWLVWERMGAYTLAAASPFNGFPIPTVYHVASPDTIDRLEAFSQEIGDWLVWERMGAYTLAAASPFNGFPIPTVYHVASPDTIDRLEAFSQEVQRKALSSFHNLPLQVIG